MRRRGFRLAAELDAAQIRLVVNADDFGMSQSISRGVLRAHRDGIVTSTSLLGNCADLDGARALLAEAPCWAWASTSRWSGDAGRRPGVGARRCWGPDGRFRPSGADFIAAWTQRASRGRGRTRVRRADCARPRRRHHHRSPGHPSPPRVPARGRARRRGGRAPPRHRRHPQRRRAPDAVLGDRPAPRPQGGRADRPGLADAAPAGQPAARPAELGLRRVGPPGRGARARDHRTARPRHARAHLPPGRGEHALLRPRGRAGRADVGARCAARWASAASRCAAGGICFERAARIRHDRHRRPRRSPSPTSPPTARSPSSPSRRSSSACCSASSSARRPSTWR